MSISRAGLFLNAWMGFYFYVHMSLLSYVCVAVCMPGLAYMVFKGLTAVTFPFYNSPVCVVLILTAAVSLGLLSCPFSQTLSVGFAGRSFSSPTLTFLRG